MNQGLELTKNSNTLLTLWSIGGEVVGLEGEMTSQGKVEWQLRQLRQQYQDLKAIDQNTFKAVSAAYSDVRARRIEVDKRLKGEKKRLQERKKEIEGVANWIFGFLKPLEELLKTEKTSWESAREAEKEAARRAEEDRKSCIMAQIKKIRAIGEQDFSIISADDLFDILFEVEGIEITEEIFQEFTAEAEEVRKQVAAKLNLTQERKKLDEEREKIEAEKTALEARKAQAKPEEKQSDQSRFKQFTLADGADDDFFGGTPAGNFAEPEEIAKKIRGDLEIDQNTSDLMNDPDRILTDQEIFEQLSEDVMRLSQGITNPSSSKAQIFLAEIRAELMEISRKIVDKLPEL